MATIYWTVRHQRDFEAVQTAMRGCYDDLRRSQSHLEPYFAEAVYPRISEKFALFTPEGTEH